MIVNNQFYTSAAHNQQKFITSIDSELMLFLLILSVLLLIILYFMFVSFMGSGAIIIAPLAAVGVNHVLALQK